MPRKQNAPARKGEGAVCLLGRDTEAHSILDARIQYLSARYGLPISYALMAAPLIFGEMGRG